MRLWIVPIIVASTWFAPTAARAQQPSVETAEALFNRAQEHARSGAYRAACPLFAASLRADPQVGTLLNLAICEEKIGALAEALHHYREAIDKLGAPGGDPRFLALARRRADELDPRVPRLTIRLAPGAPPGTRVLRGGEEVASTTLGVPVAVNPGAIEIVVRASGREDVRTTVDVTEGDRREVAVAPGLEMRAPGASPPAVVIAPAREPPSREEPPSFGRRHRASLGLLGGAAAVAVAGGALGGVTGLDYAHLAGACAGACSDDALARLHRERDATNGLFVAAGVIAAASVAVFVVESRSQRSSVAVSVWGAGAQVSVRF